MSTKSSASVAKVFGLLVVASLICAAFAPAAAFAQAGQPADATVLSVDVVNPYFTVETIQLADGTRLQRMIISGPPNPGYEEPQTAAAVTASDVLLNVPAYSWVYGCSAVSASMIAAYWDQHGLSNIYTGPTNGGVMPMNNGGWPSWSDGYSSYPNNPLTASHDGVDGRVGRGSIDDYWVQYGGSASDPYITGNWTQHTWGDAVGDYMWTSQSAYGLTDGATQFYGYGTATKLTCDTLETSRLIDGTLGRKHFYEARGYQLQPGECYSQATDNKAAGGFSFLQFKAKIDAGYPVFLNLAGHSVVGVGYNESTSPATIYLNDTWNFNSGTSHSMPWGGTFTVAGYSGELLSVSIVDPVVTTYPSVSIAGASASEDAGSMTFTASLSVGADKTVTVNYQTANGTATAGQDYAASSGTLTFDPGTTTQTFAVPLIDDTTYEGNETFTVSLSGPVNALLGTATATGTITDNDPQPATLSIAPTTAGEGAGNAIFAVSLAGTPVGAVTVHYATADGSAIAGSDYTGTSGDLTFDAGVTPQTIIVPIADDTVYEGPETFTVSLSSPVNAVLGTGTATGTITDNDPLTWTINDVSQNEGNSGTTSFVFTVSLNGKAASNVTVRYATATDTATAKTDFTSTSGTLTIPAGQSSGTIAVGVKGDTTAELDESFKVNLSNASAGSITDGSGLGTIVNDDVALPTISMKGVEQAEGTGSNSSFGFTVTLSRAASGTVTVKYTTSNGTARSGSDYISTSGTLTFTAGQTSKTINVPVIGDATKENSETFNVKLSSASGATIAVSQAVGTIVNDD